MKKLKQIGNSNECPICGSELSKGHAKKHITKLKEDLDINVFSAENVEL